MAQAKLDIKSLVQNIMLYVKLKRMQQWRWRIELATWLIELATRLVQLATWVNAEVEVEHGAS